MKHLFYITILLASFVTGYGQSKDFRIAMSNARLLEDAVFGTKDSTSLVLLLADQLQYEHSSGKTETREQAIQGIIRNRSTYEIDIYPYPYNVSREGESIMVKHVFKAKEKKADGTETNLDLTIITVWIKVHKNWLLARRKAIKN